MRILLLVVAPIVLFAGIFFLITRLNSITDFVKQLRLSDRFLFKALFSGNRTGHEEAKKKYDELVAKKESWAKKASSGEIDFNEDDISVLKNNIKKDQRRLIELKAEQRETVIPEEEERIQTVIDQLEARIKEENVTLFGWINEFKPDDPNEGYISSITIAKKKAEMDYHEKMIGYKEVHYFLRTILLLAIIAVSTLAGSIAFFFSDKYSLYIFSAVSVSVFTAIIAVLLKSQLRIVPQSIEWVMEFLGEYQATWKAGMAFEFPFGTMKRKSQVYTGSMQIPIDSKGVDFSNASADVLSQLWFRIFDSPKAVYDIADVKKAVSDKIEAGIRAYYGGKNLDEAISEKAEIDLRKIITQEATEAVIFKNWGVEIISLAITDISLPEGIAKARDEVIKAEKQLQVAKIDLEKQETISKTEELQGAGMGLRLKAAKKSTGSRTVSIQELMDYDLSVKKYDAYQKAGVLIANDGSNTSPALAGAVAGAAAKVGSESKKPDTRSKD